MEWLEVIKLQSAEKDSELLKELLASIDKCHQSRLVKMNTYHHATLETDLSVHLRWRSKRVELNGSSFGLRIAHALKEFGLVDHTIWVETEE